MTIEEKKQIFGDDPEEDPENDDDDDDEEEDLVDPMDGIKEGCSNSSVCQEYREELNVCTERVNSRSQTEETCTQELFDFLHCTDKCVSQTLFKHLK